MDGNAKTVISALVGILIGAVITYLGIEKLTEKVIETSMSLGAIKSSVDKLDKEQRLLSIRVDKSKNALGKIDSGAREVSDLLGKLRDSDEVKFATKLDAVNKLSRDSAGLVKLRQEVGSLKKVKPKFQCGDGTPVVGKEDSWSDYSRCPAGQHAVGFSRLDFEGST